MKQIIRVLLLIFHQIEQRNNAQFLLKVLNGLQCFLCVGKLRLQIVMLQVELHSCLLPIAWVLIVLDFLAWRLEARPGIKPQDLKSNQLYNYKSHFAPPSQQICSRLPPVQLFHEAFKRGQMILIPSTCNNKINISSFICLKISLTKASMGAVSDCE